VSGFNYTHDHRAFGELVLNSDFMEAEMRERAEHAAEYARSIAPVDENGPHPGRYRDSIHAESGKHGGVHHDRAYGLVTADALTDDGQSLALIVEFGTENQEGHHVLIRSLDAL
jgi:hypothetical protein